MVESAFKEAKERAKKLSIKLKLPAIEGKDGSGLLRHKPCAFAWRDLFIGCDGFVRPCQSTAERLMRVSDYSDFKTLWNSEKMRAFRLKVNKEDAMSKNCYYCYHSSCANWNIRHSFIQTGYASAPEWGSQGES
jgi:radical SAM protein with 4Fe4S-binding SPASM domain